MLRHKRDMDANACCKADDKTSLRGDRIVNESKCYFVPWLLKIDGSQEEDVRWGPKAAI